MIKLKMGHQIEWKYHRSGWKFVLDILRLFSNDAGVLFVGSLDISFGYSHSNEKIGEIIPYREEWIGFIHSAIKTCKFLNGYPTLDSILFSADFVNSLENCKGVFTLSEHVARYIRRQLNDTIDVVSLKHPTAIPELTFNFHKFKMDKKILHIGDWLKRIASFIKLNSGNYKKILLLNPTTLNYLGNELNYYRSMKLDFKNIEIRQHLSNKEYDLLLSESIVFIHLCDSSASNTIIESIVRNTPILVNWHEAVVEYLGTEYPFYYSSIEEAERKILDEGNIYAAYNYLENFSGKNELTKEHFLKSFANSSIIKNLKFS